MLWLDLSDVIGGDIRKKIGSRGKDKVKDGICKPGVNFLFVSWRKFAKARLSWFYHPFLKQDPGQ